MKYIKFFSMEETDVEFTLLAMTKASRKDKVNICIFALKCMKTNLLLATELKHMFP